MVELTARELQILSEFSSDPVFLSKQDEFKRYRILHNLANGGYLEYEEYRPLTKEVTGRLWKLTYRGVKALHGRN